MSITPTTCTRCILSTSDVPSLTFDTNGVCDICHTNEDLIKRTIFKNEIGQQKLDALVKNIKADGQGKDYDCIIGVSGGVDSSYIAYLSKVWGLRPLIVHIDNGWNSELAVKNIETILNKLGLDLYTHVLDWEQMRDFQHAFIKANVLDIDLPFESAFMAVLYKLASKHRIKYILSGHNTATEGYLPPNFTHWKADKMNLKAIHKRFGTVSIKGFPLCGFFDLWYYKKVKGIVMEAPLNYMPYNKADTKKMLIEELGWLDYGGKHYENIFTRFYQGYILPEKFGVDKRKSHFSILIYNKEITRDEALELVKEPIYPSTELLESDRQFFIKKIGMSKEAFETYIKAPAIPHTDYPSLLNVIKKLSFILKPLKPILKPLLKI